MATKANLLGQLLCQFARILTGARAIWQDEAALPPPAQAQRARVYYANHRSHADFVLVWASLPTQARQQTRPVAAADYWSHGKIRRYLIDHVFRGVLIDRQPKRDHHPIQQMADVLLAGESLIIFPEGTRNSAEGLLPFKNGIHHLAETLPTLEFVPVWIENLGRALPKGGLLPLPLLCTLHFGTPLTLAEGESRNDFVNRARNALLALAPPEA